MITNSFDANVNASLDSDGYSASILAVKYLDDKLQALSPAKSIKNVMLALQGGASLDTAINTVSGNSYADVADFVTKFKADAGNHFSASTFSGTGSILDPTGNVADKDLIPDTPATSSLFSYTWTASTDYVESKSSASSVKFQIGANEGQVLEMDLPSVSTGTLGVIGVSIETQESASKAITSFDKAIEKVSATRSTLGALQNRLEHTISNLGNASEYLTSAESRIRDTDMTAEMMKFTKNNILKQAAQTMLSQANQLPQGVLSLFQ